MADGSGGVNPQGSLEPVQPLAGRDNVVLLILKIRAKSADDERQGLLPGRKDKAGPKGLYGLEAVAVLAAVVILIKEKTRRGLLCYFGDASLADFEAGTSIQNIIQYAANLKSPLTFHI